MARARKRSIKKGTTAAVVAASPVLYEATLGANGAVIRVQPPINQAQAIAVRKKDGNVVVCGPDKKANASLARDIEQAASGRWKRCKPHVNAGPNALPHYQPDPRGQTIGHTFYETNTKHPL